MSKYFTVEILPSIIIYKQHVFLGQICLQEFSQSACYLHTFKHCLCQWNKNPLLMEVMFGEFDIDPNPIKS